MWLSTPPPPHLQKSAVFSSGNKRRGGFGFVHFCSSSGRLCRTFHYISFFKTAHRPFFKILMGLLIFYSHCGWNRREAEGCVGFTPAHWCYDEETVYHSGSIHFLNVGEENKTVKHPGFSETADAATLILTILLLRPHVPIRGGCGCWGGFGR